jgi:lysophospholipid hydrolase
MAATPVDIPRDMPGQPIAVAATQTVKTSPHPAMADIISITTLVSASASVRLSTQTAAPHTLAITPRQQDIGGWMFYFIGSMILAITRLFVWILSFATITVPKVIFKILSVSFTLTLNFSSLYVSVWGQADVRLFLSGVLLAVAYWILRYRYLTEYSRLPPEPQRKEPQVDLFPDSQEGDSKPGLQNYFDEVSPLLSPSHYSF